MALKTLGGSALAGGLADKLPAVWQRPFVQTAVLPAHAQASPGGGGQRRVLPLRIWDTTARSESHIFITYELRSTGPQGRPGINLDLPSPQSSGTRVHPLLKVLFPAAQAQVAGPPTIADSADSLFIEVGGSNFIQLADPAGNRCDFPIAVRNGPDIRGNPFIILGGENPDPGRPGQGVPCANTPYIIYPGNWWREVGGFSNGYQFRVQSLPGADPITTLLFRIEQGGAEQNLLHIPYTAGPNADGVEGITIPASPDPISPVSASAQPHPLLDALFPTAEAQITGRSPLREVNPEAIFIPIGGEDMIPLGDDAGNICDYPIRVSGTAGNLIIEGGPSDRTEGIECRTPTSTPTSILTIYPGRTQEQENGNTGFNNGFMLEMESLPSVTTPAPTTAVPTTAAPTTPAPTTAAPTTAAPATPAPATAAPATPAPTTTDASITQFWWEWSVHDIYAVIGSFSIPVTAATSGATIDETHVLDHQFTVYKNGEALYTLILPVGDALTDAEGKGQLMRPDGEGGQTQTMVDATHDFQYVIGQSTFVQNNTEVQAENSRPVNFYVAADGIGFFYLGTPPQGAARAWQLHAPGRLQRSSVGFRTSPVITQTEPQVPAPVEPPVFEIAGFVLPNGEETEALSVNVAEGATVRIRTRRVGSFSQDSIQNGVDTAIQFYNLTPAVGQADWQPDPETLGVTEDDIYSIGSGEPGDANLLLISAAEADNISLTDIVITDDGTREATETLRLELRVISGEGRVNTEKSTLTINLLDSSPPTTAAPTTPAPVQYWYQFTSGRYTVNGTFSTRATAGTIDASDTFAHSLTGYEYSTLAYTITIDDDTGEGTITSVEEGVFTGTARLAFKYEINHNQFSLTDTGDFRIQVQVAAASASASDEFTGINYIDGAWRLLYRNGISGSHAGLSNGPVVNNRPFPPPTLTEPTTPGGPEALVEFASASYQVQEGFSRTVRVRVTSRFAGIGRLLTDEITIQVRSVTGDPLTLGGGASQPVGDADISNAATTGGIFTWAITTNAIGERGIELDATDDNLTEQFGEHLYLEIQPSDDYEVGSIHQTVIWFYDLPTTAATGGEEKEYWWEFGPFIEDGVEYRAIGTFKTSAPRRATITETDVTEHEFTAYADGRAIYTVDLSGSMVTNHSAANPAPATANLSYSLAYVVGESSFEREHPDDDANFAINFYISSGAGNLNGDGLYWDDDNWFFIVPGESVELRGFHHGPVIREVTDAAPTPMLTPLHRYWYRWTSDNGAYTVDGRMVFRTDKSPTAATDAEKTVTYADLDSHQMVVYQHGTIFFTIDFDKSTLRRSDGSESSGTHVSFNAMTYVLGANAFSDDENVDTDPVFFLSAPSVTGSNKNFGFAYNADFISTVGWQVHFNGVLLTDSIGLGFGNGPVIQSSPFDPIASPIPATGLPEALSTFTTTWEIAADDLTLHLPLNFNEALERNYRVNWGDGLGFEAFTGSAATHTYATPNTYAVQVTGSVGQLNSAELSDTARARLRAVTQWGTLQWGSLQFAFHGCANLKVTAPDAPDLSRVENMEAMFTNCTSLVFEGSNIGAWDVSNIKLMTSTFFGASACDPDLSGWDVSRVTDMNTMFGGSALSTANYDAMLIAWSRLPSLQADVKLGARDTYYTAGGAAEAARAVLTEAPNSWIITDAGSVTLPTTQPPAPTTTQAATTTPTPPTTQPLPTRSISADWWWRATGTDGTRYEVIGSFQASTTGTTVREGDVTAHEYSVSVPGTGLIYSIDLVGQTAGAGTLTLSGGTGQSHTSLQDFEYDTASETFNLAPTGGVNFTDFPVDLTLDIDNGSFVGLYYRTGIGWSLASADGASILATSSIAPTFASLPPVTVEFESATYTATEGDDNVRIVLTASWRRSHADAIDIFVDQIGVGSGGNSNDGLREEDYEFDVAQTYAGGIARLDTLNTTPGGQPVLVNRIPAPENAHEINIHGFALDIPTDEFHSEGDEELTLRIRTSANAQYEIGETGSTVITISPAPTTAAPTTITPTTTAAPTTDTPPTTAAPTTAAPTTAAVRERWFEWTWSATADGKTYSATGQFRATTANTIITQSDVQYHQYTLFEDGTELFHIDLVGEEYSLAGGSLQTAGGSAHRFSYDTAGSEFSGTRFSLEAERPNFALLETGSTFDQVGLLLHASGWIVREGGTSNNVIDNRNEKPVVREIPVGGVPIPAATTAAPPTTEAGSQGYTWTWTHGNYTVNGEFTLKDTAPSSGIIDESHLSAHTFTVSHSENGELYTIDLVARTGTPFGGTPITNGGTLFYYFEYEIGATSFKQDHSSPFIQTTPVNLVLEGGSFGSNGTGLYYTSMGVGNWVLSESIGGATTSLAGGFVGGPTITPPPGVVLPPAPSTTTAAPTTTPEPTTTFLIPENAVLEYIWTWTSGNLTITGTIASRKRAGTISTETPGDVLSHVVAYNVGGSILYTDYLIMERRVRDGSITNLFPLHAFSFTIGETRFKQTPNPGFADFSFNALQGAWALQIGATYYFVQGFADPNAPKISATPVLGAIAVLPTTPAPTTTPTTTARHKFTWEWSAAGFTADTTGTTFTVTGSFFISDSATGTAVQEGDVLSHQYSVSNSRDGLVYEVILTNDDDNTKGTLKLPDGTSEIYPSGHDFEYNTETNAFNSAPTIGVKSSSFPLDFTLNTGNIFVGFSYSSASNDPWGVTGVDGQRVASSTTAPNFTSAPFVLPPAVTTLQTRTFSWIWTHRSDWRVTGQFTTTAANGEAIAEGDVLSHTMVVTGPDETYTIDVPTSTSVTSSDVTNTTSRTIDFQYVVGENTFAENNTTAMDPDTPVRLGGGAIEFVYSGGGAEQWILRADGTLAAETLPESGFFTGGVLIGEGTQVPELPPLPTTTPVVIVGERRFAWTWSGTSFAASGEFRTTVTTPGSTITETDVTYHVIALTPASLSSTYATIDLVNSTTTAGTSVTATNHDFAFTLPQAGAPGPFAFAADPSPAFLLTTSSGGSGMIFQNNRWEWMHDGELNHNTTAPAITEIAGSGGAPIAPTTLSPVNQYYYRLAGTGRQGTTDYTILGTFSTRVVTHGARISADDVFAHSLTMYRWSEELFTLDLDRGVRMDPDGTEVTDHTITEEFEYLIGNDRFSELASGKVDGFTAILRDNNPDANWLYGLHFTNGFWGGLSTNVTQFFVRGFDPGPQINDRPYPAPTITPPTTLTPRGNDISVQFEADSYQVQEGFTRTIRVFVTRQDGTNTYNVSPARTVQITSVTGDPITEGGGNSEPVSNEDISNASTTAGGQFVWTLEIRNTDTQTIELTSAADELAETFGEHLYLEIQPGDGYDVGTNSRAAIWIYETPQATRALTTYSWDFGPFLGIGSATDTLYRAIGSFKTTAAPGATISEADVTEHEFSVYEDGRFSYSIDLANGMFTDNDGTTEAVQLTHRFVYVVGESSFQRDNHPDPAYTLSFIINLFAKGAGLSWDGSQWTLNARINAGTFFDQVVLKNFEDGPVISEIAGSVTTPAPPLPLHRRWYRWTNSNPDFPDGVFTVDGAFSFRTAATSGDIGPEDLESHQLTVYRHGILLFRLDFDTSTLIDADGMETPGTPTQVFTYPIDGTAFTPNTDENDPANSPNFRITLANREGYSFYYTADTLIAGEGWKLERGTSDITESETPGAGNGPMIQSTPFDPVAMPIPATGLPEELSTFTTVWQIDADDLTLVLPFIFVEHLERNYRVNWGDRLGYESFIGRTATHTYAAPGTYTVRVTGSVGRMSFARNEARGITAEHPRRLLRVEQWGTVQFGWLQSAFLDCVNLTITAPDTPDLSQAGSTAQMFRGCTSLVFEDSNIGAWDVSSIHQMLGMFRGASAFNPDLSNWNVSNVTNMTNMLLDSALSTANYDAMLIAWSALNVQAGITLDVGDTQYTASSPVQTARMDLTDTHNWTINDGGPVGGPTTTGG